MSALGQLRFHHQLTEIGSGLLHRIVLVEGIGDDVADSQLPEHG